MTEKMKDVSSKNVYKQRAPTVESPFGTLKLFYNIDIIFFKGRQKVENMMNLYAIAYNLNKIYKKLINTLITEDITYISFVKTTIAKYKQITL